METDGSKNDARDDPRPTEELLAGALDNDDPNCVLALQYRGTREVFDAAATLCQSPVAKQRGIGVWILGQLGVTSPTFVAESVDVLLAMLNNEPDTETLENIVVALGHRRDPRAIDPVVALQHHPAAYVRYGVALALMSFDDDRAVDTLITLSADADDMVRDWATFGLGSIQDVDTPAVRQALIARIDDPDDDTRGEALVGLARRRDPRVTAAIRRELAITPVSEFAVRAATEFPDTSFLPPLLALSESGEAGTVRAEDVAEAVARCTSAS